MNMKKSIAGVMAGAMAVSAMATVVSADQDAISLTYDLKTYVNDVNKTKAKVTVVANYEGTSLTSDSIAYNYVTFGADNGYITGGDIYNKNGVKIGVNANASKMTDFEFTARPYKDLAANDQKKYQTFKATKDAANVDGSFYDPESSQMVPNADATEYKYYGLERAYYNMRLGKGANVYGKFDITNFDMWALGYCDGYSNKDNTVTGASAAAAIGFSVATAQGEIYGFQDAVAKMTYEIPNTVYLNKANGWGWIGDATNWSATINENQIDGVANTFHGYTTYGDVTMTADSFAGGFFTSTAGVKKGVLTYSKGVKTALYADPTTVGVGSFTAGAAEEAVIPFKSTLKPGKSTWVATKANGDTETIVTYENDVISALQNRKAGGNHYTKPVAVINDAIANHDNVVFTFTSYNNYVGTTKSHAVNQWVNVDQGYTYETSGMNYDWHNPTFGQHLYTNLSDAYSLYDTTEYDMYGSYSSAWGINLFTGAVVVNSGLTMQLNDTDKFDWGNNTLSFDWFDIIDDGKITDAKTFLTSMLLYTPVDWYWDNLTVVVSDDEDESIDAGEGLEGEGDVLDEEIVEEVEEAPVEEVEEVEAPVEAAPSPATGNAPVALAVIPVALAAAAVVAKKRN